LLFRKRVKAPLSSFLSIDEYRQVIVFKPDVFKFLPFLPTGIGYALIYEIFWYGVTQQLPEAQRNVL
jgi:hypothetical protein